MIGHSIGEYVAACPVARSRGTTRGTGGPPACLMQDTPPGSMLAVRRWSTWSRRHPPRTCSIAAIIWPTVRRLEPPRRSRRSRRPDRRHRPSAAAHVARVSPPMMEPSSSRSPIVAATATRTGIPLDLSRTGRPITDEEAVDPYYWARQPASLRSSPAGSASSSTTSTHCSRSVPAERSATLARQHDRRPATQLITTSLNPAGTGTPTSSTCSGPRVSSGRMASTSTGADCGPGRRRQCRCPPTRSGVSGTGRAGCAAGASRARTRRRGPGRGAADRYRHPRRRALPRLRALFVDLSGVDPRDPSHPMRTSWSSASIRCCSPRRRPLQSSSRPRCPMRTLLADAPTLNLLAELPAEHPGPTLSLHSMPSPPDRSPTTWRRWHPTTPATTAFGPVPSAEAWPVRPTNTRAGTSQQ